MRLLVIKLFYAFILLLVSHNVNAIWQTEYNRNGILIQSQSVTNSDFLQIKASVEITDDISSFYQFLSNPDLAPIWLDKVVSSERIARLDEHTVVVQTIFDGFGPVLEREMLVRSQTLQTADGFVVNISSYNHYLPSSKKRIRVKNAQVQWRIKALQNGLLNVTYIGYFDPGGKLPAWISNYYAIKSIKTTFENLQRLKPVANKHRH